MFGFFRKFVSSEAVPEKSEVSQLTNQKNEAGLTEPQLVFLSEFMTPKCADKMIDYWGAALSEEPNAVLKRFVECGLLVHPPLAICLGLIYKAADLKLLLKEKGLPVSGAKQVLIERLLLANIGGMGSIPESVYECSDGAKIRINSFLAKQDEEKNMMIREAVGLLRDRKIEQALNIIFDFNKTHTDNKKIKYGSSPFAIEAPPDHYFRLINSILAVRPKILKDVSNDDLERLRIAVAMWQLGCVGNGIDIPMEGYVGTSKFSQEVARMMVLISAKHRISMEDFRKNGSIEKCEIVYGRKHICKIGQSLDGRIMPLDEIPELPHPDCTEEQGCSCFLIPKINWGDEELA